MEIEMIRSDTKFILITLVDASGEVLKLEDLDLLEFSVKKSKNDKKTLIHKTNLDGIVALPNGKYKITILPEDTKNLSYGTYKYDLQLTSNKIVRTLALGELTLTDEITF